MAMPSNGILVNDVFGSYRVLHQIGEGGMGEVYLAEHKHIDRKAAIKVLRPEFSANADLVNRFFAEARSANLIKHQGIVEIYDCSVLPNGCAYIVMEYLEGQSLGAALERVGHIDEIATMVDLSWQIATTLQAAHDKNIIHRDLKPDNIFLTFVPHLGPGPVIKVLDFGIAKLLHSTVKHTRTGSLLGTPLYMSPEQARGLTSVDHRSDIYSLGCIMFEMNTGRTPFVRDGMGDLIIAHASEIPPPASKIQPKIPPEIDQLITGMLAKRPEHRPRSMQKVAEVLHMFLVTKGGMAATVNAGPGMDDGPTSQFHRPLTSFELSPASPPASPAALSPRPVVPTAILPPSEAEPRQVASIVQTPMMAENSWIARAQRTAQEPRPRRRPNPHANLARRAKPAPAPPRKGPILRILLPIAGAVLVGGIVLAMLLFGRGPAKPLPEQELDPAGSPPSPPHPHPPRPRLLSSHLPLPHRPRRSRLSPLHRLPLPS